MYIPKLCMYKYKYKWKVQKKTESQEFLEF